MRNYIIGGVILVLMGLGGFINYNRERSGECSADYVVEYLRPELVAYYLKESSFYENMTAGLSDSRVTDGSRTDLEQRKAGIDAELEGNVVFSREVSPSTRTKKTCLTRLDVNGGIVEARYNLTTEPMPGTEFAEKYEKRRKNIILRQELEPGTIYDTVDVAVFSRRSFYLKERPFPELNYAEAFIPEEAISSGVIADVPK